MKIKNYNLINNKRKKPLPVNIFEMTFSRKEMNSLINDRNINEVKSIKSVFNKIKLIAKKTKIGFNALKNFFKKIYFFAREIPKVKIIAGVLLITISSNLIEASVAKARTLETHNTLSAAVEEVKQKDEAKPGSNLIFSDGKGYYIVPAGNQGLDDLIDCIKSGSDVPELPEAVEGIEVSVNVTFSETSVLSDQLESVWGKYKNLIQQNEDLNFVHINAKVNDEKVNFVFIPNPEKITYEEVLEILKSKNIKLPDPNLYQSIKSGVGEKTGVVNGSVSHPKKYPDNKWSFVFGKSESAKGTLLHEASHLFGIQKSLSKMHSILSKAESRIELNIKKGIPIDAKNLTGIPGIGSEYDIQDIENGISKDHMINLIGHKNVMTDFVTTTNDIKVLKKQAEWVFSIGLGLGRIKPVKGKKDLYIIVAKAVGKKLDYYTDAEEISRYEDSIRHFIEEAEDNKSLAEIGKKVAVFYKEIDLEKKVKLRVEKVLDNIDNDPYGDELNREIANFRSQLISQFNQMVDKEYTKNKNISQKDKEIISHYIIDVIFFLCVYYSQEIQNINAEGQNIYGDIRGESSKINSLVKLDRFSQQFDLHESINRFNLLKEKVYMELLKV